MYNKLQMNKHTIIVIISIIVIAITLAITVGNLFLVYKIEYSVVNQDEFRYFGFINEENISVCNPTSFYTNLNNLKITINYEGRDIGVLNFPGTTIAPHSSKTIQGKFTTDAFEEVQYLAMHFDGMFLNTIPVRIDPTKMVIITEIQTHIVGFIPYTISKQYSALEFWNMMNEKSEYTC